MNVRLSLVSALEDSTLHSIHFYHVRPVNSRIFCQRALIEHAIILLASSVVQGVVLLFTVLNAVRHCIECQVQILYSVFVTVRV